MLTNSDKKDSIETAPYTIQLDDTFYKISKYYSITLEDLIEANPSKDPDNIRVGDTLCIPLPLQKINFYTGFEYYTIKESDTIYKLAKKFNISINALLKANSNINPDALLPGQIICIPKPWNSYRNSTYKIGFMYPTRWAKISSLHYEGVDGFFRISSMSSIQELEEACKEEAYHKLKPYGSQPEIVLTTAAGLKACLAIPSEDQPMEMKKQAAIIIQYPQEVEIDNQYHNHLIIWVDKEHMYDIKNSLIFLD